MERAKTKNRLQRRWNFWGYLFILPNFIGFVLFMLVPIIMALVFSFTNYDVISTMDFIGFENYIDLFTDDQFLISLRNTLWYCVLTVPSGVVLALLIYMATSLLDLRGQIQTAQVQRDTLARQVSDQRLENQELEAAIENSDDPDMLESVARDKGYVKSGETLYIDVAN